MSEDKEHTFSCTVPKGLIMIWPTLTSISAALAATVEPAFPLFGVILRCCAHQLGVTT